MNINQLMKQAQNMQKKIQEAQKEVENIEVEGTSGGGMVKVTMGGDFKLKSTTIDPKIIDPEDAEMLEDLITAAVNDASTKAEEEKEKLMSSTTGGMNSDSTNVPYVE